MIFEKKTEKSREKTLNKIKEQMRGKFTRRVFVFFSSKNIRFMWITKRWLNTNIKIIDLDFFLVFQERNLKSIPSVADDWYEKFICLQNVAILK